MNAGSSDDTAASERTDLVGRPPGAAGAPSGIADPPDDDIADPAAVFDSKRSVLESRYRRLLRLLPLGYRAVREEEMVGTFLAAMHDADPENFDLTLKHGRPSAAEMRAVAALALRARWGETVAPERFAVRRDGLRAAVLMSVTVLWTVAVADLCWLAWALTSPKVTGGIDIWAATFGLPVGSWQWFQQWSLMAWLPTLPLVVFGGRAGARWAAVCVALPSIVSVWNAVQVTTEVGHLWPGYLAPVLIDVAMVGGLLALGAARPEGTAGGPVRYLVAAVVGIVVLNIWPAFFYLGAPHPIDWNDPFWFAPLTFLFVDEVALWCWAAVIAALWTLTRWRRGTVRTANLLALSVFAGVAAVYRFLASIDAWPQTEGGYGTLWTAAVVTQFALAAAICVISGLMAARRLRRLPARLYPA